MSNRTRNVLVTGADGFIGSTLTERLVRRGDKVTALALYNSFDQCGWLDDLSNLDRSKLTIIRGDVRDAALIRRIVEGQEIVFHLAALIAIPHSYVASQSYVETNVMGTLNVLEAARACNVQRMIHTSTSEVYGTALRRPIDESHPLQGQSPYSASKIGADMMAEAYARSFELPVAILRPFNTFGPRQSERAVIPTIIRQALDPACGAIFVGDISTERDFTFVEDAADAFLVIGDANEIEYGRAYNVGTGKAVTIREIMDLVVGLTDCKKKVVAGQQERLRPAASEVRALLADCRQFSERTGWRSKVSLRQGLGRTVEWWQDRLQRGVVRREHAYMT